jgi:hypothetical protein
MYGDEELSYEEQELLFLRSCSDNVNSIISNNYPELSYYDRLLLLDYTISQTTGTNYRYTIDLAQQILGSSFTCADGDVARLRTVLAEATRCALDSAVRTFDFDRIRTALREKYAKRRARYESEIEEIGLPFKMTDDVGSEIACALLYEWVYKSRKYISYFDSIFPRLRRPKTDLQRNREKFLLAIEYFTIAFNATDAENTFRALRTVLRHLD